MKHVTVVGGGFVGCEVALALAKRGRAKGFVVTQVIRQICRFVESRWSRDDPFFL